MRVQLSERVIGLVWPGPVEPSEIEETNRFLPEGVTARYSPTGGEDEPITLERLFRMAESSDIEKAASIFSSPQVDVIAYACTSASYVRGVDGAADIVDRIERATGLPTTTTSSAVARALHAANVRSVAVLSPHVDELNEQLRAFLEQSGFDVVHMRGLNRLRGIEQIPPEEIEELVVHLVDRPEADSVFISCTGMKTAVIIDRLQERLGKPVVSALQVTIQDSLRIIAAHSVAA